MNVYAETKPKQSTVFCRSILIPPRIQFKAKDVSVKEIIPETFHVLRVSARWVSQNLSAHDRHWRVSPWVHAQVTKNCFVVVSLLGTKLKSN